MKKSVQMNNSQKRSKTTLNSSKTNKIIEIEIEFVIKKVIFIYLLTNCQLSYYVYINFVV